MAKVGEGDERWIVDDLGAQGTNVSAEQLLQSDNSSQIISRL